MAVTITRLKDGFQNEGKFATQIADVTLDSSYATGGEAISAQALGLKVIYGATVLGAKDATSAGYPVLWDYDSGKLLAMYGDNNNASDGPLIEVPNATDLSAVTVRLKFIGLGG